MANSVDPDQMLHSVVSDLGLHVCKGLSVPIFRVIMVLFLFLHKMYVVCTHWKQFGEAFLMSNNNIHFCGKMRKYSNTF